MSDENDTQPPDDVEVSAQSGEHVEAQLVVGTGTPGDQP